jgi:DNA-cytosine methyltransferase
MRHGSLFSGIGGFDLASEWMGWENVFQVEWDGYCQKVLAKNFPNVKRYGNIKEFDGTKYRGLIDIISGGFPCQPFSNSGKRKGRTDDRYLWPQMLRVIGEIKPTFVIGENVSALLTMENGQVLDQICSDLENKGYTTEQYIIPACAVGTIHIRERLWIIAYSVSGGLQNVCSEFSEKTELPENTPTRFDDYSFIEWPIKGAMPENLRKYNGVPRWMDRIKGLGNAIVPQVAYQIFRAIEEISKT